jgi:hypothetical protein
LKVCTSLQVFFNLTQFLDETQDSGAVLSWLYGKLYYLSIWDDAILQNFINKLTWDWKNVQMHPKKRKRENFQDIKLAQTRCQNLSMSKINHMQEVSRIFLCQKSIICNKSIVVMGGVS